MYQVKGRVKHGINLGLNTALTAEQGSALEAYLLYLAQCGFPLTTKMAQAFAWVIAFRSGIFRRALQQVNWTWEALVAEFQSLSQSTFTLTTRSVVKQVL